MKLSTLPALVALFLLAASCTSGTEGIFASIEREQKIVSLGGLNKFATVTSMAEYSGTYYATGGRALFSRATTATTWDKSTVRSNSDIASVGAIPTVGVFAVAGGKLWTLVNGSAPWTDITPAGATAYSLVPVIDNDGFTVVSLLLNTTTASGDHKTIYQVTAASQPTVAIDLAAALGPSPATTSLAAEVTSAVKATGGEYYLVNDNYLWYINNDAWTSGATAPVNLAASATLPAGKTFQGLLVQGTTGYLTTKEGTFYTLDLSTAGSPVFTTKSSGLEVDSGHATWLHTMIWNTTNSSVWIATGAADSATGKEGNGYVEWNGSSLSSTPNTDDNNYTSSLLPTYAVGTLFRAPTSGDYFLGTVAHGLWKWDSTAKTWSQQ